jgi:hypothetical protein
MKNNNFACCLTYLSIVKMKKLSFLCSFMAVALFVTSCVKDPERHILHVSYPVPCSILYADEQTDSLVFETYDSYKLTSLADWITISAGESYDVKYNYMNLYFFKALLSLTQNTTGRTRQGSVRIDSYDHPSGAIYYQLGCLNIKHPMPVSTDSLHAIPDSVSFDLLVDATAIEDSICFNVSKHWTMNYDTGADSTWATINAANGNAGYNKVLLSLTANPDTLERTTVVTLKCGEVTNFINIKQLPFKEEPSE